MSDEPRAWLIGESPSRTGDRYWRFPLSGAPAKTLCQCADFPPDGDGKHLRDWSWALYSRFRTVNLFQRYAEATPWSTPAARERGRERLERLVAWDASCAVLLGRRVGSAFGLDSRPYFEWTTAGLPLVVIPHPSGRNLLMNDAKVREWVGKTLRAAAELSPSIRVGTDGVTNWPDYAARCRAAQHHSISGGLLANVASTKTVTMRFDTTPIREAMERIADRTHEAAQAVRRWTVSWTSTTADTGPAAAQAGVFTFGPTQQISKGVFQTADRGVILDAVPNGPPLQEPPMPATSLPQLTNLDRRINGTVLRTCRVCRVERELNPENFYTRAGRPPETRCQDCRRRRNAEVRAARAAGTSTARPARSRTGRKFGVEVEFVGDRTRLIREMRSRGVAVNNEGYNHRVRSDWKIATDGSVYGGWELVSPPLSGEAGIEQVRMACEALTAAGCRVDRRCGLHVHHDVRDLDVRALGRVFRQWHYAQPATNQMVASSRRSCSWAAPLRDAEVRRVESLANLDPVTVRSHFYGVDRYRSLNVACFPRQGTIEVRQHQGTTSFKKIASWIAFGQAVIALAKSDAELQNYTSGHEFVDALVEHGELAADQARYLKGRVDYFANRNARVA